MMSRDMGSVPGPKYSDGRQAIQMLLLDCQGDREAELFLPISPLCDRNNTLVAESQIGA